MKFLACKVMKICRSAFFGTRGIDFALLLNYIGIKKKKINLVFWCKLTVYKTDAHKCIEPFIWKCRDFIYLWVHEKYKWKLLPPSKHRYYFSPICRYFCSKVRNKDSYRITYPTYPTRGNYDNFLLSVMKCDFPVVLCHLYCFSLQ